MPSEATGISSAVLPDQETNPPFDTAPFNTAERTAEVAQASREVTVEHVLRPGHDFGDDFGDARPEPCRKDPPPGPREHLPATPPHQQAGAAPWVFPAPEHVFHTRRGVTDNNQLPERSQTG